jgi:hypothetical protein
VHDRRARPTLRVLREQLTNGWTDVTSQRILFSGRVEDLCPLAELPHPLVAKARELFGSDPTGDSYHQTIACAANLGLLEIRAGQWRGGVWTDPATGVRWLVTAGLAKGGHEDSDDFYIRLTDAVERGRTDSFLPTPEDVRLLKIETANATIRTWELDLQEQTAKALALISNGGRARIEIVHPTRAVKLAAIDAEMAIEAGAGYDVEAFVLDFDITKEFRTTKLAWTLVMRMLTGICPPQQDWDRVGDSFSAMAEVGHAAKHASVLIDLTQRGELCRSEPGKISHYAHHKNLADSSVQGLAVRAMCGRFFVPYQDHDAMHVCPECNEIRDLMPEASG